MKKDNKEVKKTNYGEDYNRESMYGTIQDEFYEGREVIINGKKCDDMIEVMIEDIATDVLTEDEMIIFKRYQGFLYAGDRDAANEELDKIIDKIHKSKLQPRFIKANDKYKDEKKKLNETVEFLLEFQDNNDTSIDDARKIIAICNILEKILEDKIYSDSMDKDDVDTLNHIRLLKENCNKIIKRTQKIERLEQEIKRNDQEIEQIKNNSNFGV